MEHVTVSERMAQDTIQAAAAVGRAGRDKSSTSGFGAPLEPPPPVGRGSTTF